MMGWLSYVPYVLLFMAATILIYGWGLWRGQNQQHDLQKMLTAKAVGKVQRAMKKQGSLDKAAVMELVKDIRVHQPFSKAYLGVTQPDAFAEELMRYMVGQHLVMEERGSHGRRWCLRRPKSTAQRCK